jgi:hypothetical protein
MDKVQEWYNNEAEEVFEKWMESKKWAGEFTAPKENY